MLNRFFTSTTVLLISFLSVFAQYGNTPPLHVEGKYFVDPHGNKVVLHGVMDTPNPYFNSYRWGNACNSSTITPCVNYFNKLFTAITDTANGAWCDVFRLHLDPCWTNDPNKSSTGENDISAFSSARLRTYLRSLYFRIAKNAIDRGLYIIMRPPGVFPETVQVGDDYNKYLQTVWDIVSQNDSVRKYSGQIMLELGNEPVNLLDANGQDTPTALREFFQPIVDKIRANGFTGVILLPGTGWQSNYRNYATNPVIDYNYGYAVHDYVGWYNTNDNSYNKTNAINSFKDAVPVVEEKPIVITEVDWSPTNTSAQGHYNEHGDWVQPNYGTWATGSTSKWGSAFKAVLDHFGNISMTLTGTGDFIDIDQYVKNNKVVPAFTDAMTANGLDPYEACGEACFRWYKEYAQVNTPHPAFRRQWTADQGNGTYINPILNADFPDVDVIRVGDTFYMVSTTMYHFPGATLLKSKDLVNWEYCANPLQQIDDNDAYNLINGAHHYAQGQWAASLNYYKGKFYIYFICYGRSGVDSTQNILLTATDPAGTWTMTKMSDHYYDSGWLFDDGENGDGFLYIASGIGNISVSKLNPSTLKRIESKTVITVGNGCEGSHMYHIGDYYYIYATYGGTEGSQTIFRATDPMGPYEEHDGRVFANQHIHQGAFVQTQTGEWWTILFKDAGAVGRIPYLEPVKWTNGWPVIGNDGIDVSATGKAYKSPDVGATCNRTYLPTNDTFTDPKLNMQWQWNHNPDNSAWSLFENPGYLRLHTAYVTDNLNSAHNSLTQRIFAYNPNATAANKYADSYGTVKMDISHMQEGDVAGLAVFQNPYSFIAVKMVEGKKVLYSERCAFNSQNLEKKESVMGDEIVADSIYLRAIVNFGTNSCKYYYSADNENWTQWGVTMTMGYTLDYFVGQRFYLFNYATKQLGGYVDIDWFSTEPVFSEDYFYGEGVLKTYTEDDLTMTGLTIDSNNYTLMPGATKTVELTATFKSGITSNVAANTTYEISDPSVVSVVGGKLVGLKEGAASVTATYTDVMGNVQTVGFKVTVAYFPLVKGAFNPSVYGTGSFIQVGDAGALTTSQYGFGGWEYSSGVDLSEYDYLVVTLRRAASCSPSFRLFDQNNYWSIPYMCDMGTKKTVEIDLHNMVKSDGTLCDPSHIYIAGFWSLGGSAIYISEVKLVKKTTADVNEDGVVDINDVVAVINQMAGTASWRYADVNGDSDVDINDVVAVINNMAGN